VILDTQHEFQGKLLWLPIAVPRLPDISDLLDPSKAISDWDAWNFRRLTVKRENPYDISEWAPWVQRDHAYLIDWFESLPFKNLRNVKLNLQNRPVTGHIDFTRPEAELDLWKNNNSCEPCGYRIIVKGDRKNGLWVQQSNGNRINCQMPDSTDTYVLRHTDGMHGVNDDQDRWTIFYHAEIDRDKHASLMAKSLDMYREYAIWDDKEVTHD